MFTLNNILNVASSAVRAHQLGVQVTSQNISNAQTEGYSRQRVMLRSGVPISTAHGPAATGVRVAGFERARDPLLDVSFRRDTGKAASYGVRRDLLREVENVFGEPSDSGIGATMEAFWAAWDDLATDPLSSSARGMVRQRASQVTSALHSASAQVATVAEHSRGRLQMAVEKLNTLGSQVAKLNVEIVSAESGGASQANDLRDLRDGLLDEMASLAHTRVTEHPNGSVSVVVENTLFVDAGDSKQLEIAGSGLSLAVQVAGPPPVPLSTYEEGSTIGEILKVINVDLVNTRDRLDEFAAALVTEVNAIHTTGNNGTADPFFDPLATTAGTIALSSAVSASASAIATGTSGLSSDNSVALLLGGLRTKADLTIGTTTPTSFNAYYRDIVSDIALEVRSAEDSTTVYEALVSQTDLRRQSVSGVSIDEELIQLMQHQQAYVAATRVITAVDEMLRDLLGMIR